MFILKKKKKRGILETQTTKVLKVVTTYTLNMVLPSVTCDFLCSFSCVLSVIHVGMCQMKKKALRPQQTASSILEEMS